MRRRPPRPTRTDTLFPYPSLFRAVAPRVPRSLTTGVTVGEQHFRIGTGVRHAKFGEGTVIGLSGIGQDSQAQIQFRDRSEEHTSELQSLMRISYAVFCLKKKNKIETTTIIYYAR